jgi:catechol 2,3-dioxygenase-like lactoylglutathione lyase family enzyme
VNPLRLDHVALWVADRDAIAATLTDRLGMHVIEQTDRFTLVGSDARRGKLTLFAADGPRVRGALEYIAVRVSSLDGAPARLDLGEGLELRLVEAPTDVEYDLDHVALLSTDPMGAAEVYTRLGFEPTAAGPDGHPRVAVGGSYVELHPGEPGDPERPLLNHLAVLVDSAEEHRADAEGLGFEIADFVDAPNTIAVFVWGPDRVKIEYVEQKPGFSLT